MDKANNIWAQMAREDKRVLSALGFLVMIFRERDLPPVVEKVLKAYIKGEGENYQHSRAHAREWERKYGGER